MSGKTNNLKEFVPTKSEMEVLQILWQHGPSTVRFVHNILNEKREPVIYTSTLKLMQVMADKGVLERDETNMSHVYTAVLHEEKTKKIMLDRFVDSIYNGSPSSLMLALLDNKTSKEELKKIKELLNQEKTT